jgi:peptidylprolyl isomerase
MKVQNGHNVSVHYRGTLTDGTEFDNSRTRGETLDFQVGAGGMIRGFVDAVVGMTVGETKSISIPPENAYGPKVPEAIQQVEASAFASIPDMEVGGLVQGNGPQGPFVAKVADITDTFVTLDLNHPLAGETLNFEIELVSNTGTPTVSVNAKMKKAELLEIAQSRGLSVTSRNTKAQILEALTS